jgi:REP element-mobilizing transposase RayT
MAHTKAKILVHMVFATKERLPLITPDFKPELHSYMAGTARSLGVFLHALGGVEDHCHLVFDLPPKIALADFANQLKSNTSRWATNEGSRDFKWQRGYGAFSVNFASLDRAVNYVLTQEDHHAHQSFRDEQAEFLRVHDMDADAEFIDGVFQPSSDES